MTRLFVALLAVLIAYGQATGASIEYCRPYAAQTVDLTIKYLWTRAYTSCLNSDDDPALAETSQGALKSIVPLELLLPGKPDKVAADPPAAAPGRSGYVVNSPGWIAYCKKYWPASFDPRSGTVIKTGHKRIPCPG
jgi:hypothetical protein